MRNTIVIVQLLTMLALGAIFWKDGLHRLAVAQACYGVATCFLFLGRAA